MLLRRSPMTLTRTFTNDAPVGVSRVLASPGQPLEGETRALMEPRFAHDFSGVRVHTDGQAAESARAVDAQAYTVGRHLVFSAGHYAPATAAGRALLAHELTHVVQQGSTSPAPDAIHVLGAQDDPLESEARQVAASIFQPVTTSGITGRNGLLVQRQPASSRGAGLPRLQLLPALNLPVATVDLEASESITRESLKLVSVAESFKSTQSSQQGATVEISAYLSASSRMNSAKESEERARLSGRMSEIRRVLQALGVPREQITVQAPTVYSSTANGQVGIRVYGPSANRAPLLSLPQPQAPGKAALTPPAAPAGSSALSDLLKIKYGPLSVDLPKSIALKVPIPISTAKTLTIDLRAEVPGVFSFAIAIDGLRYVRIAAKAGLEYDKDKGLAGSAGLQIQLANQVLNAPNPEALRSKITAAGGKLTRAMQDYKTETDEIEKLSKLADVASALGEMYDAVEAAKSSAKPVPAATLDIGVKAPLGSQEETDPAKRHPSYIGATLSFPF